MNNLFGLFTLDKAIYDKKISDTIDHRNYFLKPMTNAANLMSLC